MRALVTFLVLALLGTALACERDSLDDSMPPSVAPLTKTPVPEPEEPSAEAPSPSPPPTPGPRVTPPGFSKVAVDDEGPLCVFSDHDARAKAPFPKDAKPQKLKADASVVFGAYPPWCVHESCDQIPSLQCKVTQEEGNVLVVHTHYWGEHKAGSTCTECREITAGCESPPLPAGKYTVRHGEQVYPLRIPSNVRKPCF